MATGTGNAFDFNLFRRLLKYTNPYKWTFYFVAVAGILLSFLAILRPYLLLVTIDESILRMDGENLVYFITLMLGALMLEVIFQFLFIYFANWLGQEVIRDLRVNLFKHMLRFKIKYFDKSAVGRLVTRAAS